MFGIDLKDVFGRKSQPVAASTTAIVVDELTVLAEMKRWHEERATRFASESARYLASFERSGDWRHYATAKRGKKRAEYNATLALQMEERLIAASSPVQMTLF